MIALLYGFEWALWRASWQACALAGLVLLLQKLLGRRIGGHGRYLLWSVVIVRLLLPITPQARWSLFNLTPTRATHQSVAMTITHSTITESSPVAQAAGTAALRLEVPLAASAPVARPIDWATLLPIVLSAIWAFGVILLGAKVIAACRWLRRVERTLGIVNDARFLQIIESSLASLALRFSPRVLAGEAVKTPAVVGVLRPALWLPARVLCECDEEQLRLIVMHELAHLKRNDVLGNWLIAAASIVHWFNPLVWLIAMRMRADRELACDELVLSLSDGRDAQAYGRTLLKVVEILTASSPKPRPQPQLVGILESTRPMQRRVRMIARFDLPKSSRWFWTFALLLVLGCTTLTDAVHADDPIKPAPQHQPALGSSIQPAPANSTAPQDTAELQRRLEQVMPEVKFEEIGFSDAINFLRDRSGANIVVNWRALENAGIDRNAPVSLQVLRITIEQALDHILHDLGGGQVKLDWTIDKGAVVISTQEDLASRTQTVTYDISDLMIASDGQVLTGEVYASRLDGLLKLIQTTIAPDSWKNNGGVVGSMMPFNNKLVIQTTPRIQLQIQHLLDRLREAPTTQPRPLE